MAVNHIAYDTDNIDNYINVKLYYLLNETTPGLSLFW